ncbi:MAG: hypothetical protein ACRD28_09210, partial [Acidobacteriaceae bacterium]
MFGTRLAIAGPSTKPSPPGMSNKVLFEVPVKKSSNRIFFAGLPCVVLAFGLLTQPGHANAQATTLPSEANHALSGDSSNFLASLNWQPMEFAMAVAPQQDQSMPPYRQPRSPKPQPGPKGSYSAPAQSNQSNSSSASDEAFPPYVVVPNSEIAGNLGSTYIPLDSWIYPALMRLYSLGYLDRAFVD